MEFLFGALTAILSFLLANQYLKRKDSGLRFSPPMMTQSTIYELQSPIIDMIGLAPSMPSPPNSQSYNYLEKISVRVVFTDGKAYWVAGNTFYSADLDEEGYVEENSTSQVDIMGMDSVELEKMSYIVEMLTEGKRNDNRGSGNQEF